ncbi:hypothetical protein PORY_001849 [Pneumocystis oryctolagi]|uniref:Uncharacterized protein n=1 Tax=Pneumocystis oryctolagi TaxID=42067 RepID=A0ACB7CB67_9ASCO|nr:hypothetical protein PORY_001849 [Pneumocystis oryctolagi]
MSKYTPSCFSSDPLYTFPVEGLLPKDEIESLQFLKKYPEFDGRGVIVAVLDTGIDPAAAGMQYTTDGKPKIIDIIDCSGAGDVDMTTFSEVFDEGDVFSIIGLSGKKLKVNKKWKNPDGKWRLGIKRAYEIFPESLISRLKKERYDKFNQKHTALLASVQNEINMFRELHKDESILTKEELELKLDLEAQYDSLKKMMTNYEDPGPIYDCLVWHDGENWRAVIDTNEDGDLTNKKPMCDYRIEHHYEQFSKQDMLSYSVNIYDNGSVLSLVTLSASHGTHVSGIIGAYHPNDPDLNGIAPGVQFVSLKIGDSRLGTTETNQSLLRAAIAMINLKVDIANMSYGESTGISDAGIFIDFLRKTVIGERDIIFVSSSGNNGPALSTLGTPGGTTSGVISVGAYVTTSMIKAEYSILENAPEGEYTWTSRGPTADGARGVTIYAPGAAITSVPTYVLSRSQLMNGTSMSSPSVCGGVSLILSALKAQKIKYTPLRIYKAIENASKDIGDPMNVGFLQVEKSYEYFLQHREFLDQDFDFKITVNNSSSRNRGIYLREYDETHHLYQVTVEVKPSLKEEETMEKYNLELRLILLSSKSWVKVPNYLLLNSAGRIFDVQVDPTNLPYGFHYAEIVAYDTVVPRRKLFFIPVTVCKPEPVLKPLISWKNMMLISGYIERKFIFVPEGASYAELRIRVKKVNTPIRIFCHFVQLVPHLRLKETEHKFFLKLCENELISKSVKVIPGLTMEVCFANFWSSTSSGEIDVELEFHGLKLSSSEINTVLLGNSHSIKRLEVINSLSLEVFDPVLKLSFLKRSFYPSSNFIRPLGERDTLPDSKALFEMILTYSVKFSEDTEAIFSLPLSGCLYDSSFCFLTALYNKSKRLLQFGETDPKKIKLKNGEYVFRVQLIHSSLLVLERIKNMSLIVIQSFADSKEITLNIFNDNIDAFDKEKPQDLKTVFKKGDRKRFVVNTFINSKDLPKDAKNGDCLVGKLYLEEKIIKMENFGYPVEISLVLGPEEHILLKENPNIVDLQVEVLNKLKDDEEKKSFLEDLLKRFSNEIVLLDAKLKTFLKCGSDEDIISIIDSILNYIDFEKITEYIKSEKLSCSDITNDQKKEKEKLKLQKSILINTLQEKAKILGKTSDGIISKEFNSAFEECKKWIELPGKDYEFLVLQIRRFISCKSFGLALQLILKLEFDLSHDFNESEIVKIFELKDIVLNNLKWSVWVVYQKKWKLIHSPPKGYILFVFDFFNKDKLKLKGCKMDNVYIKCKKRHLLSLKMMAIKKIVECSNQLTVNILKLIPWNGVGEYLWKEIVEMGYDSFNIWKTFVSVYFDSIESPCVFNRNEVLISSFISILREIDCSSLSWLNILDINNNKALSTKDFIYLSYLHNLVALNVSNTNLTDMILNHWGRAAQRGKFLQLLYIDIRNNQCSFSSFVLNMGKFKSLLYFSIEDYQLQKANCLYKKYPHLKPPEQLIESVSQCRTFEESYKCIFNFHSCFVEHSIIYHLFIKSQNSVLIKQNPPLLFYGKILKDSISSLDVDIKKNTNVFNTSVLERKKIYRKMGSKAIENWKDIIE